MDFQDSLEWSEFAGASLEKEVRNKNLAGVLRILSEDIVRWYEHLKGTWLEFIEDNDGRVKLWFSPGSPFLPAEYSRPFFGEDIAVALLEFQHDVQFAEAFRNRLQSLHENIRVFVVKLCSFTAQPVEERPADAIFDLDEHRKDVGALARGVSAYINLIAEQFDKETPEIEWLGPKSPAEWATVFGVTWETIKKRIREGKIVGMELSAKSWKIRAEDVPKKE